MSKFFCDTNCELWFDKAEELNINVIKMPYTIDGVPAEYDLGKSGGNKEFFDKMRKGATVKTQALNQQNYIDYFEPILKSGEDIIYVTFTHAMSATFNYMQLAINELKEKYPERTISFVDSKNISMGAGLIVYYAAKLHNEGASDAEVVKFVENFRDKLRVAVTVNDLAYLKRGGRLSAFKAMMGTILNMKPIIEMSKEGKLENTGTVKGRKKALSTVVDMLDKYNVDPAFPIALVDGDASEDAAFTVSLIKEKYPSIEIWQQLIGPVIGSHCGPDTIAMIFVTK